MFTNLLVKMNAFYGHCLVSYMKYVKKQLHEQFLKNFHVIKIIMSLVLVYGRSIKIFSSENHTSVQLLWLTFLN